MSASDINDLSRLAVHTMTTKPWDLKTAAAKYAAAGIPAITIWRQWLAGMELAAVRRILDDHDLTVAAHCRGGFFPASDASDRQKAIDDNLRCIDEAAAIGAPMVVLVCGAVPGQSLFESRKQIADGIAACLTHAEARGVKLAIEPLHPMYADDRSAVNTLGQANDLCDAIGSAWVGIAADVYHLWWDDRLEAEIKRAGSRILGFHLCDWMTPTSDLLLDRGLMGEGCINIREIRGWVEATGFTGYHEVEIFSTRHWERDQDTFLEDIKQAYTNHC
ncbi:MAG: sugar phosphate isomerase/epimerase [Candidatus Omnitrophota bacterium]|jgi:sugar phosphate isomerase/epimerase